jgi:uncharacterized protein (DUF1697 family)
VRPKYAVFFRNLNLGRPNCPTKAQFEHAFASAGAATASSFLTNGTIVFSASPGSRAHKVLRSACQALQAECGLREPAFIRPLSQLVELVRQAPFAGVDMVGVYQRCISFLPSEGMALPDAPCVSPRGDVEILQFTASEALSLSRKVGNTAGSPNAFLEKLLATPATTRNWNTVLRLVERHN